MSGASQKQGCCGQPGGGIYLDILSWILYLVNTWFCFGILFLSKTPTSQSRFLSILDQLEPQFPYL